MSFFNVVFHRCKVFCFGGPGAPLWPQHLDVLHRNFPTDSRAGAILVLGGKPIDIEIAIKFGLGSARVGSMSSSGSAQQSVPIPALRALPQLWSARRCLIALAPAAKARPLRAAGGSGATLQLGR